MIEISSISLPGTEASSISEAALERSVLVNIGKPRMNTAFQDYCAEVSASQVKKHVISEYSPGRIDVAFDTYKQKSLKEPLE